jgi:hypothetical protein
LSTLDNTRHKIQGLNQRFPRNRKFHALGSCSFKYLFKG